MNSIQLKHESITINEMTVGPLVDMGSSIDIIDLMGFTFDGIQSKGQKIRLFKTNEKTISICGSSNKNFKLF